MSVKLAKELNPEANSIYHFLRNCWQKYRHENVILAPLKTQGVCRLVSGMFWGFGCVRFGLSRGVTSLSRIGTTYWKESKSIPE